MAKRDQHTNDYWQEYLSVGPFGGLDTTTAPFYVAAQNFVDGENFVPNTGYGGYYTVKGRKVFLASPLPGPCTGLTKMSRPGLPDVYIFAVTVSGQGQLYYAEAGGNPTVMSLPETLTPNRQTSFASSGMWMFMTNGTDTPLKIDTSLNVTFWGIVAPTVAPTAVASNTGGAMGPTTAQSGYVYCVTFGNANQESSQGAISSPVYITTNTGSVALSNIQTSTDPQVTERNIYRLGGSLGQWRLVTTLHDNTTTTYTDTLADVAVDGQLLTIDRDPPPAFTAICEHQERIFGFGSPDAPSTAYFSNFGEPYGFNLATGTIPCGENSFGDTAVQLASIGSVLCCHKVRSFYAIYGTTDADFQSIKLFDIGTVSAQSVASAYGQVWWLSNEGIYTFNGNAPTQLSDGQYQTSNIKSVLDNLDLFDKQSSVGFIYDRMYHLSFPTILKTYYWDIRTQQWWRLGFSCTQAYFDLETPGANVIALDTQSPGSVDNWFQTGTDLGNTITSYLTTRVSADPSSNATKRYRFAAVEAPSQPGQKANIIVTVNPGDEQIVYPTAVNLYSDPAQFTHANVYQVDLPDTLVGVEVQFTLKVFSTEQVTVNRAAILGTIDAVLRNQS